MAPRLCAGVPTRRSQRSADARAEPFLSPCNDASAGDGDGTAARIYVGAQPPAALRDERCSGGGGERGLGRGFVSE